MSNRTQIHFRVGRGDQIYQPEPFRPPPPRPALGLKSGFRPPGSKTSLLSWGPGHPGSLHRSAQVQTRVDRPPCVQKSTRQFVLHPRVAAGVGRGAVINRRYCHGTKTIGEFFSYVLSLFFKEHDQSTRFYFSHYS